MGVGWIQIFIHINKYKEKAFLVLRKAFKYSIKY